MSTSPWSDVIPTNQQLFSVMHPYQLHDNALDGSRERDSSLSP